MRGLLIFVAVLAACSEEELPLDPADAGAPDLGVDAHAPLVIDPPAPVIPPKDPEMTPCPENWAEVLVWRRDDTFIKACEPYPEGEERCPIGQAQFPGELECAPIGRPCPSGDWPEDLGTNNILYVRPGGTGPQSGTRAEPYRTIGAAIAARDLGAVTIALAKGTYTESIALQRNVTLSGACPAETVLALPLDGADDIVVGTTSQYTAINNVRIRSNRIALWVSSGELDVRDVVIERARAEAIYVEGGGVVTGGDVTITGVGLHAEYGTAVGILGLSGSKITLDRVMITGQTGFGVVAQDPETAIHLTNSAFRNLNGQVGSLELGRAGHAVDGAHLKIERSTATHTKESAFNVSDPGSQLELYDVVIRDVDGLGNKTGSAIQAAFQGHVIGERLWIERAKDASMHAQDAGRFTLKDVIATDVGGAVNTGRYGRHFNLLYGTTGMLERAYLARARETSVFALSATTTLTLKDVRIEDNLSDEASGFGGNGVTIQEGVTSSIARLHIEAARYVGLLAIESNVEAEDVLIRDMGSQARDGTLGPAIVSQDGSNMTIHRVFVERGRYYAVYASAGTLTLYDAVVRETLQQEAGGEPGYSIGLIATSTGGALNVTRALVENNGVAGVSAAGPVTVRLSHVVIRDNTGDTNTGLFGEGLYAERGSTIELEHGSIERAREFGAYANLGAHLILKDVRVSETFSNGEGVGGYGLYVREGSSAEVDWGRFDANRVFGAAAEGEGTTIALRNVEISNTQSSSEGGFITYQGNGLGAINGGYLHAKGFVSRGASLCGVIVAHAQMDLEDGMVTGNLIGANVAGEGFDLRRLRRNVRYKDNRKNLDLHGGSMPYPDLGVPDLSPPPQKVFTEGS
jgi:hypothetical protein